MDSFNIVALLEIIIDQFYHKIIVECIFFIRYFPKLLFYYFSLNLKVSIAVYKVKIGCDDTDALDSFYLDSSTGSSEGVHDTEITDAGN